MSFMKRCLLLVGLILAAFLVGCQSSQKTSGSPPAADLPLAASPTVTLPPPAVTTVLVTLPAASISSGTASSPNIAAIATSSPEPTISPTPDPYAGLTIADLSVRSYGGGELVIEDTLARNSIFTRYLVSYPSDGLRIYGFMNVPNEGGPFPVVIALHGYIEPEIYQTLDYTTGNADSLARAGFLVLHPNLRGYPPSDDGPNLFRVGMAVDVLNLIEIVKVQGGQVGPLEQADPASLGLWGHSMGGGVSTRVMTVSPDVDAVVLYGAMSGDERRNYERIFNFFSDGQRGQEELSAPPEAFLRISPANFLDRVQAAVSIHHGQSDGEVPPEWSAELCDRLQELGKRVECFMYPGQPHTFSGDGESLFEQRVIEFFDRELRQ